MIHCETTCKSNNAEVRNGLLSPQPGNKGREVGVCGSTNDLPKGVTLQYIVAEIVRPTVATKDAREPRDPVKSPRRRPTVQKTLYSTSGYDPFSDPETFESGGPKGLGV